MKKFVSLPLIFLFVASCLGLILRWHHLDPISGFKYSFWLHAHSHIMFLGWVFNALSIAFVISLVKEQLHKDYYMIFIAINILLVGMLVLFPLQGYGAATIILSSMHTLLVLLLSLRFFRDTRIHYRVHSFSFARISLVFFIISAIGPLALGAITANGLGHTNWYRLAVYYYLHFQYNGVFTFGVFALLFRLLEEKEIEVSYHLAKLFKILLLVSCFPAYILSTLWTKPGILFNVIGFLAGLAQIVGLLYFTLLIRRNIGEIRKRFSRQALALLIISFAAFATKLVLQLISAHPFIAALADEVRIYTIAYLHLVLIGMVSCFLLAWYMEKRYIGSVKYYYLILLISGFVGSEFSMISLGLLSAETIQVALIVTSFLMVSGIGGLLANHLGGSFELNE
jgi:hypothetical protein